MMVILLGMAGLFILMGVLIKRYKCYWLISGYNTASKERKKQMDVESIGRLMGKYFYFLGGIFVLFSLIEWLGYHQISVFAFVVMMLTTIYIIIAVQKYDAGAKKPDGSLKIGVKVLIAGIIIFLLSVAGFVIYGLKPTEYTVTNNNLTIDGVYGTTLSDKEIKSVELIESIPAIRMRTNGYALNNVLRGYFTLDQLGNGKLFIQYGKPPYIFIQTDKGFIIINATDAKKTKELYGKIRNF